MKRSSPPGLPLLCSLMVLSGAASLTYEIVWLRMLTRAFGVTVHAVSFLVSLYFGGLVLGSLAASRWTRRKADWLGTYALLEAAGCLSALLATAWMARLPDVVAAFPFVRAGGGLAADTALRFCLAGPALILPTFFFGATLPVLCRHAISQEGDIRRGVGALYGANTLGAMAGVLAAGFWTIAYWGEISSTYAAAALNITAAGAAFYFSGRTLSWGIFFKRERAGRGEAPGPACLLFAISGFCALGYEVLWTRKLVLLMGSSAYAFSLFLFCYLGGTALGSVWAARLRDKDRDAWELFGRLELLMAATALLSLFVSDALGLMLDSPAYLYSPLNNGGDLPRLALHAAAVVVPTSIVMGFLFPVAARLETSSAQTAGTSVGRIYAYNTAGGILGSLAVGFGGVAVLGAQKCFLLLTLLNMLVGAAALAHAARRARKELPSLLRSVTAFLLLPLLAAAFAPRHDRTLDILTRRMARKPGAPPKVLFHEEAAAGTATGMEIAGSKFLFINGIEISGTGMNGALMTAIPNVFQEKVERTLIIGVGAGTTLVAASLLGGEVHAAELLKPVAANLGKFQTGREWIYERPETRIFFEDGRNFLLRSRAPYDLVVTDISPPLFSAGAVNLYTVEFFELVLDRLTPRGIFALWLPLPTFEEDYWDILKGLCATFPHIAVWNHPDIRSGVILFGSRAAFERPPGLLDERLKKRVRPRILSRLSERSVREGLRLTQEEIRAYVRPYRFVTDDRPITEYPLGKFLRGARLEHTNDFLMKAKTR